MHTALVVIMGGSWGTTRKLSYVQTLKLFTGVTIAAPSELNVVKLSGCALEGVVPNMMIHSIRPVTAE